MNERLSLTHSVESANGVACTVWAKKAEVSDGRLVGLTKLETESVVLDSENDAKKEARS